MRKTLARRWLAALLTLTLVFSLVPAAFAAGESITLSDRSISLAVGQTRKLTATLSPAGTVDSWESDNTSVATVSDDGTVTAVARGTATITAKYGDDTATCNVTVNNAEVTSIDVTLNPDTPKDPDTGEIEPYEVDFGDTFIIRVQKVEATWSNTNVTDETQSARLEWSASVTGASGVVSLSSYNGKGDVNKPISFSARVVGEGTTTITVEVTYNNVVTGTKASKKVDCVIKVKAQKVVVITDYNFPDKNIEGTPLYAVAGENKNLVAYVAENGKRIDATLKEWESTDQSVATISPAGVLTPIKKGQTEISVTFSYGPNPSDTISGRVICIVSERATSGGDDGDDTTVTPGGDKLPEGVTMNLTISSPTSTASSRYMMSQGSVPVELAVNFIKDGAPAGRNIEWSQNGTMIAVYTAADGKRYEIPITWSTSNRDAVSVTVSGSGTNRKYSLVANDPGDAEITFSAGSYGSSTVYVTVNGFKLVKDEVELSENETLALEDNIIKPYGTANITSLSFWSDSPNVAAYVIDQTKGPSITAYSTGTAKITVSGSGFSGTIEVTVKEDPNSTINYGTLYVQTQKVLNFSDLLSRFRQQAGGRLSHITGLNMNSSQGTIYYKYNTGTGSGVGVGAGSYYHPYRNGGVPVGQPSLEDLTFVPKSGYAGEVTIHYTGVSEDGKNYVCKLVITVDPGSGSNAGTSLTTGYNTPLKLSGDDFSQVCRERLGVRLDYVTFSQPPERQGKLYTNYVATGNYGSVVDPRTRFNQKALDDVWFVPAPGYSGSVTVYYTAFGTDGSSFAGQVDIVVTPENNVAIGGLAYDIAKGGVARFDDADFGRYCRQLLDNSQTLSFIRFDSLPAESEGVLYTNYTSISSPGTRAAAGTSYYYGTHTPRIDRLAFVAAADFVGTVKIPFTGWTTDGTRFTGNVEVNVRSGVATSVGDILYICPAGRTVSFNDSDFNRMSREVTGSSLNYITFRNLPSSSAGTLYYNNARANTSTNYRNGSSTPRIDNLSFRASNSFSGTVDLAFDARATSGETFRGVVTISSSAISSSGSSGSASNTIFTDMGGYSDLQKTAVDFLYNRGITHGLTATQYGPQNSIRRGDFALMLYTAFGFSSSGASQAFVDVPVGAYYGQAVNALYSRGVVSGIGGGLYAPDSTLTRQDAICMVQRAMRASGRNANDGAVSVLYSYNDGGAVSGYAQGAMALAVQQGFLPTYGSWLNPTQPLTRVDMAEILYRVLG